MPMSADARASAAVQPVRLMTTAATMTATEPARSPITSRYAPRMFRLCACASRSRYTEIRVPDEAEDRDGEHQPRGDLRRL